MSGKLPTRRNRLRAPVGSSHRSFVLGPQQHRSLGGATLDKPPPSRAGEAGAQVDYVHRVMQGKRSSSNLTVANQPTIAMTPQEEAVRYAQAQRTERNSVKPANSVDAQAKADVGRGTFTIAHVSERAQMAKHPQVPHVVRPAATSSVRAQGGRGVRAVTTGLQASSVVATQTSVDATGGVVATADVTMSTDSARHDAVSSSNPLGIHSSRAASELHFRDVPSQRLHAPPASEQGIATEVHSGVPRRGAAMQDQPSMQRDRVAALHQLPSVDRARAVVRSRTGAALKPPMVVNHMPTEVTSQGAPSAVHVHHRRALRPRVLVSERVGRPSEAEDNVAHVALRAEPQKARPRVVTEYAIATEEEKPAQDVSHLAEPTMTRHLHPDHHHALVTAPATSQSHRGIVDTVVLRKYPLSKAPLVVSGPQRGHSVKSMGAVESARVVSRATPAVPIVVPHVRASHPGGVAVTQGSALHRRNRTVVPTEIAGMISQSTRGAQSVAWRDGAQKGHEVGRSAFVVAQTADLASRQMSHGVHRTDQSRFHSVRAEVDLPSQHLRDGSNHDMKPFEAVLSSRMSVPHAAQEQSIQGPQSLAVKAFAKTGLYQGPATEYLSEGVSKVRTKERSRDVKAPAPRQAHRVYVPHSLRTHRDTVVDQRVHARCVSPCS